MLFSGQLDIIDGPPLIERFLLVLDWDCTCAYKHADRHVWKVKQEDTEVAGFVIQVNNFIQVNTET